MSEITLDDIKRFYEGTSTIYIKWLIEQAETFEKCAERNEELEGENKALHNGMKMLDRICDRKDERLRLSEFRENRTRERKKLYREAIEGVVRFISYSEKSPYDVNRIVLRDLHKALERDNE